MREVCDVIRIDAACRALDSQWPGLGIAEKEGHQGIIEGGQNRGGVIGCFRKQNQKALFARDHRIVRAQAIDEKLGGRGEDLLAHARPALASSLLNGGEVEKPELPDIDALSRGQGPANEGFQVSSHLGPCSVLEGRTVHRQCLRPD